jgi:hypothetical protein
MLRFLDRQKTGKNEEAIELSAIEIFFCLSNSRSWLDAADSKGAS